MHEFPTEFPEQSKEQAEDPVRTIQLLRKALAAQELIIKKQAAMLSRTIRTFEHASEAAGIGLWECRLPDDTLTWSGQVYDFFDMPRGHSLERSDILKCYSEASLHELSRLRSKAISDGNGFTYDAEITTCQGNVRWLRITATVELEDGVPVRIFGLKQDITKEKLLADQTRYLAEYDMLTGLPNRSQFEAAFTAAMANQGSLGALILIDLDGFKQVNDTFGHSEGDDSLKEAAFRLRQACAGAELVARLGGDEFAVLMGPGWGREGTRSLAQRVVDALDWEVVQNGNGIRLSCSVGIAYYRDTSPAELFKQADAAMYAAKKSGKATFREYEAP